MFRQLFIVISIAYIVCSAPQGGDQYEAYQYQYEVKDPEKQLFFDKNEAGDASGKVSGQYSVWLPDGRLMTVKYSVDKESGYVSDVDFKENANPLSGKK